MKNNPKGFLLVDKKKNISSFDCIRQIKRQFKKPIKIGHTGTLDNFATGLLIVAIDRSATKLIDCLMNLKKEYYAVSKLGEFTDTLDCTGEIIKKESLKVEKDALQKVISSFIKKYEQVPPIYSALKFNGKPLYKIARNELLTTEELNKIVIDKRRIVEIYEAYLEDFSNPFFSVRATVSKGTYMRSFMNNIAEKLNSFSTCYELRRTKIGMFSVEDAIEIDELNDPQVVLENLISVDKLINRLQV